MKADYTHIAVVLDRSGSMARVASDTIGGFNHFIDEQKKAPGIATLHLTQFDDVIEVVYDHVPLSEVPHLTSKTFQPRNATALLDAIGRTINHTGQFLSHKPESARPAKVVFVIMTDGLENASKEFDCARIFDMIKHQREKYGWEFVFIGANQDAIATGTSIGVATANNLTYAHNAVGTQSAFAATASNLCRFRSGEATTMCFSAEQRKEQEEAGAAPSQTTS